MDRINWKGYLLEFFTVVMGILLAFGLNNWNENRKERVNAQQYLQGIKQEIQLNLEEITEKLVYHQNLQKELIHNPASVGLAYN